MVWLPCASAAVWVLLLSLRCATNPPLTYQTQETLKQKSGQMPAFLLYFCLLPDFCQAESAVVQPEQKGFAGK